MSLYQLGTTMSGYFLRFKPHELVIGVREACMVMKMMLHIEQVGLIDLVISSNTNLNVNRSHKKKKKAKTSGVVECGEGS